MFKSAAILIKIYFAMRRKSYFILRRNPWYTKPIEDAGRQNIQFCKLRFIPIIVRPYYEGSIMYMDQFGKQRDIEDYQRNLEFTMRRIEKIFQRAGFLPSLIKVVSLKVRYLERFIGIFIIISLFSLGVYHICVCIIAPLIIYLISICLDNQLTISRRLGLEN